ncbi:histone deacetylase [Nocardioides sp. YIM 152315]|uniref:histone deacetylase n=1 Tax=Nocardioides sp. YIM 152315 TaxID=3031760 RepID=UPI0023DCB404|nr:histone deacetylase [Nocardioides sp. YIM 152315]MDF1602854.1 histone deacetylase [Nocardioides sp. YIM 152315]
MPLDTLWYAAYGSNLDAERFRCYLLGGCPPGAARTYPGAREPTDALDDRPFRMPGQVRFAWRSPTWGGGVAFHDPDADAETLARAYLVTADQFADVLEQEMGREPGVDHDLDEVLFGGRHAVGPGHYETVHLAGELDGRPVLTFSTSDVEPLGLRAPAPAYVATMARGLRHTHDLDDGALADYLLECPGATPAWSRDELLELLAA